MLAVLLAKYLARSTGDLYNILAYKLCVDMTGLFTNSPNEPIFVNYIIYKKRNTNNFV